MQPIILITKGNVDTQRDTRDVLTQRKKSSEDTGGIWPPKNKGEKSQKKQNLQNTKY
jgi:hypothetical protein